MINKIEKLLDLCIALAEKHLNPVVVVEGKGGWWCWRWRCHCWRCCSS